MRFLILVAALVAAVHSDSISQLLSQSTATLTGILSAEVAKGNQGHSVVLSALSLEPLLGQLSLGAVGSSRDQLLFALGIPDKMFTRAVFSTLTRKLLNARSVGLHAVSSLFVSKGYHLDPVFARDSLNIFRSQVKKLHFWNSLNAASVINSWVKENTYDQINGLVDARDLRPAPALVMCNAVTFKGIWKHEFLPQSTRSFPFHESNSKATNIPTMYQQSFYNYGVSTELDARLLQLPYDSEGSYMLVVVPNEVEGLDDLMEKLIDPDILREEENKMKRTNVRVLLPKFKIETKTNFNNILKKIGIVNIFDKHSAELNNLVNNSVRRKPLSVTKIIQKAIIEVDEGGSGTAAVTDFINLPLGRRQFYSALFVADRPFAFFINIAGMTVFSGTFTNK